MVALIAIITVSALHVPLPLAWLSTPLQALFGALPAVLCLENLGYFAYSMRHLSANPKAQSKAFQDIYNKNVIKCNIKPAARGGRRQYDESENRDNGDREATHTPMYPSPIASSDATKKDDSATNTSDEDNKRVSVIGSEDESEQQSSDSDTGHNSDDDGLHSFFG